ncbi:MAG: hypothetical protein KatS3mg112_1895 [Thermogutta sp.]|nr:MAG: hypothetical protein KatS3mg112_1895 [Thermogutta sp.]
MTEPLKADDGRDPSSAKSRRRRGTGRLSPLERAVRLVFGLVVLGLLGVAWELQPSPSGFGTHEQLGLPRCAMVRWFGLRCPTCGMTTAWSHWVRGQWREALQASVSGTILAMAAAVVGLAAVVSGLTGIGGPRISMAAFNQTLIIFLGVIVTEWLVRLIFRLW